MLGSAKPSTTKSTVSPRVSGSICGGNSSAGLVLMLVSAGDSGGRRRFVSQVTRVTVGGPANSKRPEQRHSLNRPDGLATAQCQQQVGQVRYTEGGVSDASTRRRPQPPSGAQHLGCVLGRLRRDVHQFAHKLSCPLGAAHGRQGEPSRFPWRSLLSLSYNAIENGATLRLSG